MLRWTLLLVAGCVVGPTSSGSTRPAPAPEPEVQPEWNVQAEENLRGGEAVYAERVRAAPKRGRDEEIQVTMQADSMDFFRKSIAHGDTARDLKLAFDQIVAANAVPSVRLELNTGGIHEQARDWYESMTKTQRKVDVYVRLVFRTQMQDENNRACPGMRRPLLMIISAVWSSAYVRQDHALPERSYCRAGYPEDLGESVPEMRKLVEEVIADIDVNVRAELPALSESMALSPPHRAGWQWRRPTSDGRLFGIF